MVLSHLAIRDLTRASRVSKQWQRVTRERVLFLEPAPTSGEYLDWLQGRDQTCYQILRDWQPVIALAPTHRATLYYRDRRGFHPQEPHQHRLAQL
jgi:hypothetical protein